MRQCLQMPSLPSNASRPRCESSRYLCSVCGLTCGFCVPSGPACKDGIPVGECLMSTDDFLLNASRTKEFVPATGYCDAVLPPGRVGAWLPRADGWRYHHVGWRSSHDEGNTYRLADELSAVRRQLSGQTVVFVGDSNMRYQYTALASFVRTGIWPPPRTDNFSVCSEGSVFGDRFLSRPGIQAINTMLEPEGRMPNSRTDVKWKWRSFFNQSSQRIGDACDCEMRSGSQIENRFFSMPQIREGGEGARATGVRLAFLGSQGNGHLSAMPRNVWAAGWTPDLERNARTTCVAGLCAGASLRMNNTEFVRDRLRPLRPDVVVFGPGPWMRASSNETASLLQEMRAVLRPGGRAIFRTCPRGSVRMFGKRGCSNGASCDESFRKVLDETGWELFDLFALTDALWGHVAEPNVSKTLPPVFADNFHYHTDSYREWNRDMLRMLRSEAR